MDVRNFTYMFYGFAAAWVIVLLYTMLLTSRDNKLRREMDRLRRMIEDREVRK
jgi:CcmD family protein